MSGIRLTLALNSIGAFVYAAAIRSTGDMDGPLVFLTMALILSLAAGFYPARHDIVAQTSKD